MITITKQQNGNNQLKIHRKRRKNAIIIIQKTATKVWLSYENWIIKMTIKDNNKQKGSQH